MAFCVMLMYCNNDNMQNLLFQDHHLAPEGHDRQHVGPAQGVPLAIPQGIC